MLLTKDEINIDDEHSSISSPWDWGEMRSFLSSFLFIQQGFTFTTKPP